MSFSRLLAESGSDLWYVGVILVLFGSISQNLGNNLASLAYSSNDDEKKEGEGEDKEKGGPSTADSIPEKGEDEEKEEMTFWEKNLWAVGTGTFIGGSLMTFVAFAFAAQSLLAALESVQFVSNVVFAKLVHKEEVTWLMMAATLGIVGGNTLVVLFSSHSATIYTGEDIFAIWRENTDFHIYLGVMGGAAIVCEYFYRTYNHSRMVDKKLLPMHSSVEPGCYCVSSAFVGSFAVVNAKCIAMFLQDAEKEFQEAPMYTILITWIIVVAFWLRRMDGGLELFPPLFFIPTLMAFFIFFSIICGGIFFEEFKSFSGAGQYAGFFIGVFCILAGVFFLAPPNDMEVEGATEGEADRDSKVKPTRRLSYSDMNTDRDTTTSNRDSESTDRRSRARSRASTMAHPLAALKEAHNRASQIEFIADFEKSAGESLEGLEMTAMRTVRRASLTLGLSSAENEPTDAQKAAIASLESATDDAPPRPPAPSGDEADIETPVAKA